MPTCGRCGRTGPTVYVSGGHIDIAPQGPRYVGHYHCVGEWREACRQAVKRRKARTQAAAPPPAAEMAGVGNGLTLF